MASSSADLNGYSVMLPTAPLSRTLAAFAVLGLAASPTIGHASDKVDPYDGDRHFTLTPYVWLPNLNATLDGQVLGSNLGDFSVSNRIGPNDYLQDLKFGAMVTGEVRKGDWSAFTDISYIDFGDERSKVRSITALEGQSPSTINRDAKTRLSATVRTLASVPTEAMLRVHGLPRLRLETASVSREMAHLKRPPVE